MRESFTLSLLGESVHVTCHRPQTTAWLREVVLPSFTLDDGSAPIARVSVGGPERTADDTDGFDDLGAVPCFALDREVIALPGRGRGRDLVVEDAFFSATYGISPGSVDIRPIGAAKLLASSFRVVRELVVAAAHNDRRVLLHASGVLERGRVVLFAGEKQSGKTTLMVHLAASCGVGIVANDRAFAALEPDGWEGHGIPTIVPVRAPTIAALPGLDWPAAEEEPVMYTLDELRRARVARSPAASASVLSLPQLALAAGAELAGGGPLACIALPRFDPHAPAFTARRLPPPEAARAIAAVRLGISTEPRNATVLERAIGIDEAPAPPMQAIAQLAEDVPCFEVVTGPDLLVGREQAAALLDTLASG